MSKSDAFEQDILKLIFNATAIANIADNAAASPLTTLFISLHTADPLDTGNESTNETAYTGYARQTIARTAGGWVISGTNPAVATLQSNVDFPACTASPGGNITHVGVGVAVSGATKILYSGALASAIAMAIGTIPRVASGSTVSED